MPERVYICELHLFLKVNLDSSIGLRYSMLIKKKLVVLGTKTTYVGRDLKLSTYTTN